MNGNYGVPEIFPSEANGSLKAVYADIEQVLKVPIVNFIFRVLAWYEPFLITGWKQVRPNLLTFEGKKAGDALRFPEIHATVPKVDWTRYYEKPTLDRIRATVFVFNEVNPKLLLIASAWAESLANRPNPGSGKVKGTLKPGVPEGLPPIDLVNIPEAPAPIRQLLLDIAEKHHHYEAASDFRALANYPQFLNLSWQHLREYVGSREYTLIRKRLLADSVTWTKSLPYAVTINTRDMELYHSKAEIAGIMGIVSMFQHILPDLIIDSEFFRRMLL